MLIDQTDQEIEKIILKAFLSEINERLYRNLYKIRDAVVDILPSVLRITPTYNALVGGRLGDELGLPANEAKTKVDAIIDMLCKSVEIQLKDFKLAGGTIRGGLYIKIIKHDFDDIIKDSNAIVITKKGVQLNWLEWLLKRGNTFIVLGFSYKNLPGKNKGRSGDGLMIKRKSGNNAWRVPPEFSGTVNNNWVTRSLNDSKDLISYELIKIIEKNL